MRYWVESLNSFIAVNMSVEDLHENGHIYGRELLGQSQQEEDEGSSSCPLGPTARVIECLFVFFWFVEISVAFKEEQHRGDKKPNATHNHEEQAEDKEHFVLREVSFWCELLAQIELQEAVEGCESQSHAEANYVNIEVDALLETGDQI